jgi:hypothetical protein
MTPLHDLLEEAADWIAAGRDEVILAETVGGDTATLPDEARQFVDDANDLIARLSEAAQDSLAQPAAQAVPPHPPAGKGEIDAALMALGWAPCTVRYYGQHPEDVAYGPPIMMRRLKLWLDAHFDSVVAAKNASAQAVPECAHCCAGAEVMSAWADENRWYARLMKLAHDLAMDGRGQEAQDLRVAATHARNYRWLRDHSSPETCVYYLCSDQTQARFNDPSAVDKHIVADMANAEARERARSA